MEANECGEVREVENPFNVAERPVHAAFLNKKIPCCNAFCAHNPTFFSERGIDHHWRVIHNMKINEDDLKNSQKNMKILHGNETLRCLEELFRLPSTQVNLNCKCACAVNHEYIIKLCYPFKYRTFIRNSL